MKIKNCKCGSDAILKCRDFTITPNKYWCECLSCGHIGGIIYSGHRFNKKRYYKMAVKLLILPKISLL